jgi:hypothetical protein
MGSGQTAILVGIALSVAACAPPPPSQHAPSEGSFVTSLADACPVAKEDDASARDACAERLGGLTALRTSMTEPFLWGAQKTSADALDDVRTTRLNPLVWLKMYLSLEMFTGEYRVERAGRRTVVHAATRFRSRLDAGEYPYPFWHAEDKWDSYQFARETVFFLEDGRLVGALRSATQDRSRPAQVRAFDGDWSPSPRVVLFRRFFSPGNRHAADVDSTFRAFEAESRTYHCSGCHRPDNPAGQKQLEMLCYPNQALSARHDIVRAIEERRMPPTAGIADDASREHLLTLARAFASAADAALAAESAQGRTVAVPSK